MDISKQGTREMKPVKDLVTVWPMTAWKVKAREEDIRNRTPITKPSAYEKHCEFS